MIHQLGAGGALLLSIGFLLGNPGRAEACSVCIASDSTYSLLGQESDHSERFRIANENLWITKAQSNERHSEWRSYLGTTYGVTDRFTIAVTVPWIWKRLDDSNSTIYTRGVGDTEVMGRYALWQNRSFGPSHVVRMTSGAVLPTGNNWIRTEVPAGGSAMTETAGDLSKASGQFRTLHAGEPHEVPSDSRPQLVPEHSQVGSGAFVAVGGVDYQHFADSWNAGGGLLIRYPFASLRGYRYGTTLLASANAHYQPASWVMGGIGPLFRYATRDSLNGNADPNSGGSVVYIEPSFTIRIRTWLAVRGKVAIPVWEDLNGSQKEKPMIGAALVSDIPM